MATVCYGELHPLTPAGRIFTNALILLGVGALFYAFGSVLSYVFEGRLLEQLESHRMEPRVQTLTNHFVLCGFGRTGRMFGCETFNIQPDALVLSKQLTSGYVPMSALLVNERFYAPIAAESGRVGVFGHGFTGGGHPVAAAVARDAMVCLLQRFIRFPVGDLAPLLMVGPV